MEKARKGLAVWVPQRARSEVELVYRQFMGRALGIYSYKRKGKKPDWAEREDELQRRPNKLPSQPHMELGNERPLKVLSCHKEAGLSYPYTNQSLDVGCPRKESDLGLNGSWKLRTFSTTLQHLRKGSREVLQDGSGQCTVHHLQQRL